MNFIYDIIDLQFLTNSSPARFELIEDGQQPRGNIVYW